MAMRVKVKKWGSSLALLIPRHFARDREINEGTVLDIDSVRIVKNRQRRRYKIDELVARYKPRHRHGEWRLNGPAGREPW